MSLPDGRTVTYAYDALGRRVAKYLDNVPVERYLWSGITQLLAVYDGNGNLVDRFEGAKMVKNGQAYYLVTDQVGTVKAVVRADGARAKQIDYDSFGNVLNDSDPNFVIPLSFAGGLCDADTGLVRFGCRDYDPATGRWTAKDPIQFAGGDCDFYAYCVENPVSLRDASGQWIPPATALAEAIVGGLYGAARGGNRRVR